ncbi:hypothetical protein RAK27_11725 [Carnobacterium maltaromaticum]|uniref:Phage protein n=1 Tax=Carnobacterium maltaromaticum TaxID=2751 RepID=A0AAW9K7E6_CARML|nr:hypothetical protein [Carnobacterium maltaromaticum]MDZ5759332.1 hypothetical protein [Carnobacterium maltaromaticum]
MMIQIFKIDKTGNVIGSQLEQDGFQETSFLKRGWKDDLFKPRFSFEKDRWIESATKEEIQKAYVDTETSVEMLAQQISTLEIEGIEKDIKINGLSQQNELLGQQLSDIEIQILGGV